MPWLDRASIKTGRLIVDGLPGRPGNDDHNGSAPEQPSVLGFVMHAGEIGPQSRPADLVKWRSERAGGGRGGNRLERGENALPVGLAERHQPQPGRNQVCRHGVKVGVQRGGERNAMPGARDPDRDRQGNGAVPHRRQPNERRRFHAATARITGFWVYS